MTINMSNHDKRTLPPVLISVYTRLEHLKRCISALQLNSLALETDLFIASDGAYRNIDRVLVNEVRSFVSSISGFKSVVLIERLSNFGVKRNVADAADFLFEKYGRLIYLEDDVIVSPFFLSYMAESLEFYATDSSVATISGYMYPHDVSLSDGTLRLSLYNAWGVGLWADKYYSLVDANRKAVDSYFSNFTLAYRVNSRFPHLHGLLMEIKKGNLDAFDVLATCVFVENNIYSVFPALSLTRNIGCDGSGLHCVVDLTISQQSISQFKPNIGYMDTCSLDKSKMDAFLFQHLGGYKRFIKNMIVYVLIRIFSFSWVVNVLEFKEMLKKRLLNFLF